MEGHPSYASIFEVGIPIASMGVLALLGLLFKNTIGRLDKRLEAMDANFDGRQKNLIAHFEGITTAIGVRQNATDDRLTNIQRDFNDRYIDLLQKQNDCKLEHRTSGVRRDDIQHVLDKVTEIGARQTSLTTEFVKLKDSVLRFHAKYDGRILSEEGEP